MQSVLIHSAYLGEPDLVIELTRTEDDPWNPGKPGYTWSVTDGTYTLTGDDPLYWYGDIPEMARSLCSFLSYYAECYGTAGKMTNVDGDPLPEYGPEGYAFLIAHSETLSMGSMEEE